MIDTIAIAVSLKRSDLNSVVSDTNKQDFYTFHVNQTFNWGRVWEVL